MRDRDLCFTPVAGPVCRHRARRTSPLAVRREAVVLRPAAAFEAAAPRAGPVPPAGRAGALP